MRREATPPGDDFLIRCPRLGHAIAFSYCRIESNGLPCSRTIHCWYEHFLVEEYLRQELPPDLWDRIFGAPPQSKLLSLVDLIEQAKRRRIEDP
jgi:hypothetical protein